MRLFCALMLLAACGTGETTRKAPNPPPSKAQPVTAPAIQDAAKPKPDATATTQEPARFSASKTTSIGGPTGGSLQGGVALPESAPGFRMNPKRPNPEGNFATAELANALLDSAQAVSQKFPGSELVVGDLSLEQGGPIYHHGSHQSGRDVDVLFFYQTQDGKVFPSKGIPIEPDGTGDDYADLTKADDDIAVKLDLARTWAFVEAFVTQPEVRTARIFVVEHVRNMLLDYAKKNGGDKTAINEFARTTCQPAVPHDDHFHIRLFCSIEDIAAGCQDPHPIYPWQRAFLAEHDVEPSVAVRTRKQKKDTKKRTVSQEQAAKKAGALHRDVRDFLQRRTAWSKVPHPGRPFCK